MGAINPDYKETNYEPFKELSIADNFFINGTEIRFNREDGSDELHTPNEKEETELCDILEDHIRGLSLEDIAKVAKFMEEL